MTNKHKCNISKSKTGCKNPMHGVSGKNSPTYKYEDGSVWQIPTGAWKTKINGNIKLINKTEYHLYKEIKP